MSTFLRVSICVEYIMVIHKESMNVIFIEDPPGNPFDINFINELRRAIQFEEVELPQTINGITQATVKGKYVIVRAGSLTYAVLVINQRPNRHIREALHSFGIKMESRFQRELKNLFTEMEGNIDHFVADTPTRQGVPHIVQEVFHLEYSLPHKLGMPTSKLKGVEAKIWKIGEDLARGKGYIFLGDWLASAQEQTGQDTVRVADAIVDFAQRGFVNPIPLKQFIEQYG